MLRRLFSAFPGGWPGTSLLLLRVVFGIAVLAEGIFYNGGPGSTAATWSVGVIAMTAGILLIIGFLTPIAGALTGLAGLGLAISVVPLPAPNLWGSPLALIFGLAILVAIIGLGPGAFSVDARVFGRREIIIPPVDLPPDSS